MLTENELRRDVEMLDNSSLIRAVRILEKECMTRNLEQTAKLPLPEGRFLKVTAGMGDYPQIEITVDGNAGKPVLAMEYQDDEPDHPSLVTYFYDGPEQITRTVRQDFYALASERRKP